MATRYEPLPFMMTKQQKQPEFAHLRFFPALHPPKKPEFQRCWNSSCHTMEPTESRELWDVQVVSLSGPSSKVSWCFFVVSARFIPVLSPSSRHNTSQIISYKILQIIARLMQSVSLSPRMVVMMLVFHGAVVHSTPQQQNKFDQI